MVYKEEVERVLKAALLTIGTGAVGSSGWEAKRPGVFVEVLRVIQRFSEVVSD